MLNSRIVKPPFPSSELAARYSHEVLEDVSPSLFKLSGGLELVDFRKQDESDMRITGTEMRKRALALRGVYLGFVDCMRFLKEQAEIPAEFRDKRLLFPGTLLVDPDNSCCMQFIWWGKEDNSVVVRQEDSDEEKWRLHICWLGITLYENCRLIRFK